MQKGALLCYISHVLHSNYRLTRRKLVSNRYQAFDVVPRTSSQGVAREPELRGKPSSSCTGRANPHQIRVGNG